jgi:hypothetical protein
MKSVLKVITASILITLFLYLIFFLFGKASSLISSEIKEEKKENIEFGLNLDNFYVSRDTIRFGDSFGEILIQKKNDLPSNL